MLHIHNGDSSALTGREATIPGEHVAWREALVCGPTPGHVSLDEFLNVRAAHLSQAYREDFQKCLEELREQQQRLSTFAEHEEVVLWFEYDLFCQVQLIYLLNWFAQRELGKTKLTLICIDEFPGVQIFHGLGQLTADQLTQLFPQRREISAEQFALAVRAWHAYCSSDAVELLTLRKSDTSPLPFLENAVMHHLQRFPSTRNGLGRIENALLDLIDAGNHQFKKLFPTFARREREYGFGDAQLSRALLRLATADNPVLIHRKGHESELDSAGMLLSSFELTENGKAMKAGEADFITQNGIDLWLGGIHLQGKEAAWRWEEYAQELLVSL